MTEEERQQKILQKDLTARLQEELREDLCARLPYGVKAEGFSKSNGERKIITLCEIVKGGYTEYANCFIDFEGAWWNINAIKPFLRPISSMTEEEKREYTLWQVAVADSVYESPIKAGNFVAWLNKHHFDYRGLIKKGLALEAPEGMYK